MKYIAILFYVFFAVNSFAETKEFYIEKLKKENPFPGFKQGDFVKIELNSNEKISGELDKIKDTGVFIKLDGKVIVKYDKKNLTDKTIREFYEDAYLSNINERATAFAKIDEDSARRKKASEQKKEQAEIEKRKQERIFRASQKSNMDDFKKNFVKNGQVPSLIELVKKSMHNPDSFQHAETIFYHDSKDANIWVEMKYRGTNAFGAIMTNTVSFKFNKDGKILKRED